MTRRDVQVSGAFAVLSFVAGVVACGISGLGRVSNLAAGMVAIILFFVAAMCAIVCAIAALTLRRESSTRGFPVDVPGAVGREEHRLDP